MAQFRLAEAYTLGDFNPSASQDPNKLNDMIGSKHRKEMSKDIPVELKVGETVHIC